MSPHTMTAGVRASDAEREAVARMLQEAVADGRLSPEEGGERLAAASAARLWDELAALIADLPGGARLLLAATPAGPAGTRLGLALDLARFVVVAALLVAVWGLWGARFFWPAWPLAFMALRLLARTRRARRVGPWGVVRWRRWAAREPAWFAAPRSPRG